MMSINTQTNMLTECLGPFVSGTSAVDIRRTFLEGDVWQVSGTLLHQHHDAHRLPH